MNTTTISAAKLSYFTPSTDLLRAIALHLFNGGDYFIVKQDGEFSVYEGKEKEVRDAYLLVSEGFKSFMDYCNQECDEIEEMESDEERDSYICLTDAEADEKAGEYIKQSLWAFNADFLAGETGIDSAIFEAIQANGKREDNNDAIESCIDDMDGFIEAAISANGRGHFISGYENEQDTDVWGKSEAADQRFYIYRIN